MAKIIIELDTEKGDTLRDALDRLMVGIDISTDPPTIDVATLQPGPIIAAAHEAPAGSTTVQFSEKPILRAVETATVGAPPSAEAKWPEPTLGPMDGDRKRGEAGPGHRRRTNAQIAEDNLYLEQKARAEAALRQMDKGVHPEPGSEEWEDKKQREHDAAISSGEERVNPEDAADEAAETAARASDAPTLEDLRAAVAEYIGVHGVKASVDNMRAIVGCPIDKVPPGEIANAIAKVKVGDVGNDSGDTELAGRRHSRHAERQGPGDGGAVRRRADDGDQGGCRRNHEGVRSQIRRLGRTGENGRHQGRPTESLHAGLRRRRHRHGFDAAEDARSVRPDLARDS